MNRWQHLINSWYQLTFKSLPFVISWGSFSGLIMLVAIASYRASTGVHLLIIGCMGVLLVTLILTLVSNPAPLSRSPTIEPLNWNSVQQMALTTGLDYLQLACATVASELSVSGVWLAWVPDSSTQRVEILVLCQDGKMGHNFTYHLPGTPCELLRTQPTVYYPRNIQSLFPQASYLQQFNAQSYWGIQLLNAQNQFLGYLVIIDHQEMTTEPNPAILQFLLPRISQELERYQAFENLKHLKDIALVESAHNIAANFAKSQFLTNLSHELRTPLNAILGFAQIMARDRTLPENHQDNLGIIIRSGEHLLSLINEVLEISKIEAGKIVINESNFDLYDFLDSLLEMLQMKAEHKGIYLIFECSPEIPQYIRTDAGKLRQILINLLSNAIKFTEEGGVYLRLSYESAQLIFEVEDTGIGIDSHEINSLFEMFVQAQGGRITGEGTGLGLPISRQLVEVMGGKMIVESCVGQGSLFRFNLPICVVEADKIDKPPIIQQVIGLVPNQPPYRILVVDDHPQESQLLMQLLTSVGFEVKTAQNGQEALALWEQWHPQLIWMDLQMPEMDGYEATRLIKRREQQISVHSNLPGKLSTVIIALTATAFAEEKSAIFAAGCDDWVAKPFQQRVIFEKMEKYLNVHYIYEEYDAIQPSKDHYSNLEILNLALQKMPDAWIKNLEKAATELDDQWLVQLIEEIPKEDKKLAETLKSWVDNFRLDKITQLIKYGSATNL